MTIDSISWRLTPSQSNRDGYQEEGRRRRKKPRSTGRRRRARRARRRVACVAQTALLQAARCARTIPDWQPVDRVIRERERERERGGGGGGASAARVPHSARHSPGDCSNTATRGGLLQGLAHFATFTWSVYPDRNRLGVTLMYVRAPFIYLFIYGRLDTSGKRLCDGDSYKIIMHNTTHDVNNTHNIKEVLQGRERVMPS